MIPEKFFTNSFIDDVEEVEEEPEIETPGIEETDSEEEDGDAEE